MAQENTILEENPSLKPTNSLDADISSLVRSSSSLIVSTTSPDNPLLPLTAQEYMTLRRYQSESKIPQRFQTVSSGQSAAAERALYRTRDTPGTSGGSSAPATVPPMFRTCYSEIGQFEPNRHTAAHTYHGLNTRSDIIMTASVDFEAEEQEPGHRAAQLLASLDAGDILPEADIVSNILDKLDRNLRTSSSVLNYINNIREGVSDNDHFLETKSSEQSPTLQTALALFQKLYVYLKNAEDGIEDTYDGDEDNDDPGEDRKRRKKTAGSKKLSRAVKLQGDKTGAKADKLQYIVRDVIFYIVSDYGYQLPSLLENSGQDGFITSFLATYHVLKGHGQPLVTRSVKVTVAENIILVNKIVSRVKMERVKDNLSQEVESLKSAQARMVEEKEREGEELRENIEESNAETRARLEEIMRRTGNNIKRMEWESNRRQISMKDKIMTLLGTKKELCQSHWASERESRHKNLQLEAQVKNLLNKYDEEMFELHEKIQELENKYSKEKAELDLVEERLAVVVGEKAVIVEEQQREEARVRNLKIEEIRMRRAAITLQRAWRQYKVLQAQSKKKKKGKKK